MKRLLLLLLLLCLPGCSALQAWKGELGYNHKTGQASGQLKGASGSYHENTGLNLSTGDNTVTGLIVAAGVGVLVFSAYPMQRALRLRRERKWAERQRELAAAGPPPPKTATSGQET